MEKKKVKGWSTEEMKDRPSNVGRNWRRRLRKRFWTSTRWRTTQEVLSEAEAPFGMVSCTKKQEVQNTKEVVRKLLGKNLRLVQRIQPAASAKHA